MDDVTFKTKAKEIARDIYVRSAMVARDKLDNPDDLSISELTRINEVFGKHAGLQTAEALDNRPTVIWNITNNSLTYDVKPPAAQPLTIVDDVTPVTDELPQPAPTAEPKTATFTLTLPNLEMTDDL